ncbi:HlyD family efflux transporter periplasmic adaptor subunit, partial [bacterium]
ALESERQARAALDLAKKGPREEQISQAEAILAAKKENLALLKKGARPDLIRQAEEKARAASESLALSEKRKTYAQAFSPIGGVVLYEHLDAGEYAPAGAPVVTVGDLSRAWLRAYIQETDLGLVKIGQKAFISSDSYPGRLFEGKVTFISGQAEFTPKNIQTKEERVKLVYRIKVEIPNQSMELKPGMPVDALIEGSGS